MRLQQLIACLVFVALLVASRVSSAEEIALDLDVEEEDQPSHLCLLYFKGTTPVPGIRLDSSNLSKVAKAGDAGYTVRANPEELSPLPEEGAKDAAGFATSFKRKFVDAFATLRQSDADSTRVCSPNSKACRPVFAVSPKYPGAKLDGGAAPFIRCTSSGRKASSGRVLFVEVRFFGQEVAITSLQLQGRIAAVSLETAVPAGTHMVATVAGGDYASGTQEKVIGDRVRLVLQPRCHKREIALPALAAPEDAEEFVSLTIGARHTCERSKRAETYSVSFPRSTPGRLKWITARVYRNNLRIAEYRGEWRTAVPPDEIRMRARSVSFQWIAPCEYPHANKCPEASLPEAGLVCKGRQEGSRTCTYSCVPKSHSLTFDLPASVSFSAGVQRDRWEDQLSFVGQTLTEYASRDTRQLVVTFHKRWYDSELVTRPGDRLNLVTIVGPDGSTYQVKPPAIAGRGSELPRITMPGAVCGDLVRYRIDGDRGYYEDVVPVRRGRLNVGDPQRLARNISLSGNVGGGFLKPTNELIWRPYGQAQVTVRVQPDPRPSSFLGIKAFDFGLSYVIATQSYQALQSVENKAAEPARSAAYNRFIVDAGPAWFFNEHIQVGAQLGGGLGFSLETEDESKVGATRPFATFAVMARYLLGDKFAFEASARVLWPETIYTYASDRLDGSPERGDESVASFLFGLGGRFAL